MRSSCIWPSVVVFMKHIVTDHYALEATPTKLKSTGRSEGCSNILMTSPVTKKIQNPAIRGLRKIARIAISRKRHFLSPKRKNENTLQYKVPPKTWENSPQKPILPFESGFSAIATYKTYIFSKSPNGPILKFCLVTGEVMRILEQPSDLPVLFIFVGVASSA